MMVETPLHPDGRDETEEWVDKVLSDTFDEIFAEMAFSPTFHPSEAFNQTTQKSFTKNKVFDVINSYHAYCRLCEQHLYSQSNAEDINSFFQKHINTSYHKLNRSLHPLPADTPMFTWEEKFLTGRCNVCDMSGLNSYVLKVKTNSRSLFKEHPCVWSKELRQANEEYLRRLNALKKYLGTKIFQEKYIKQVEGRDVCVVCMLGLNTSGKKTSYHLSSERHYQKFFSVVQRFEPKDVLNGITLENMTRWVIKATTSPLTPEFTEPDDRGTCFELSNNGENPCTEQVNSNFSPKHGEIFSKNSQNDFIHNGVCLLCHVEFNPTHAESQMHMKKAENISRNLFDVPENYEIYKRNQERRLQIAERIECLKRGILTGFDDFKGQREFFQELIQSKLAQVKEVVTTTTLGLRYCQVCDQIFACPDVVHFNHPGHTRRLILWRFWQQNIYHRRLAEPFLQVWGRFGCLMCGLLFPKEDISHHIISEKHIRLFKLYCKQNVSTSISSAFEARKCFSCNICNKIFARGRRNLYALEHSIRNFWFHWPCPKLKSEVDAKENAKPRETLTQNGTVLRSVGESKDKTVDFNKVEETVERVLGVFESQVINRVLIRSKSLINNLERPKDLDLETDVKPIVENGLSCTDLSNEIPAPSVSEEKEAEEKLEVNTHPEGNNKKKNKGTKRRAWYFRKSKENGKKENGGEILVVEGTDPSKETPAPSVSEEKEGEEKPEVNTHPEGDSEENSKGTKVRARYFRKNKENGKKENGGEILVVGGTDPSKETPASSVSEEKEGEEKPEVNTHPEGDSEENSKGTKVRARYFRKNKENGKENGGEILVVEGLPHVRIYKTLTESLRKSFKEFGQVNITFQNVSKSHLRAILTFDKPGKAEAAAKGPDVVVDNVKLTLKATTRKELKDSEMTLNKALVPLLENPQALMDFMLNLNKQAISFAESPSELEREKEICLWIYKTVAPEFPQARCYPFGSRLSGLVVGNSDLDVLLDCGDMYDGFNSKLTADKALRRVEALLRQKTKTKELSDVVALRRARVPIISFKHTATHMQCDLSFKNGLSVQNTLLIKFMLSLDWRVRPLILFLKHWASLNGLHGPPNFSSYALSMMVIFYLEQLEPPVLPTVEYLQKSFKGRRKTIEGWDCSINTEIKWKSENEDGLLQLLLGLLEFYGDFNYEKYLISPLDGKPLPREAYSSSGFAKLPLTYKRHVLNLPLDGGWSEGYAIGVIDPFEVSFVPTKCLTQGRLNNFITFCKESASYLKKGNTVIQQQ